MRLGLKLSIHNQISGASSFDFSALPNLPVSRQSSAGWVDQATIDAFATASLWVDAFSTFTNTAGTTDAVQGDPIAAALDNTTGNLFTQSNAANRPTLGAGPVIAGDYQKLLTGDPGVTGTQNLIIATTTGIVETEVDLSSTYDLRNVPGLVHWVAGNFTTAEIEKIKAFAIAEGAVESWSASSWEHYFRQMGIASWNKPIPNSVTNISWTWFGNQLISWNTPIHSSVTNVANAWRSNPLQDFAANVFDDCSCTVFNGAFNNTNLTQTSIDNILVSIESNGTSNGIFSQSGGSAPSATDEIDALRARGWTVTVTGGY